MAIEDLRELLQNFINAEEKREIDMDQIFKNNDLPRILRAWENTIPDSDIRAKIEARITKVVRNINDIPELIEGSKYTRDDGLDPRVKINARIAKVIQDTDDISKLVEAWKRTSLGHVPEIKIEERIVEMVQLVTLKNMPLWFKEQLENPSWPPELTAILHERSKQLLSQAEDQIEE